MSKIVITYAPHQAQVIGVEQIDLRPDWIELIFQMDLYAPVVDISTLTVDLEFSGQNHPEIHRFEFPKPGITPQSTDDPLILNETLFLRANSHHTLKIDVSFKGETTSVSTLIATPFPVKLHDSWVWGEAENQWKPPVTKPGLLFTWDESSYLAGEYPWVALPEGEY